MYIDIKPSIEQLYNVTRALFFLQAIATISMAIMRFNFQNQFQYLFLEPVNNTALTATQLTAENVTNDQIIQAIERIINKPIEIDLELCCFIDKALLTNPCYIEEKLEDDWKKCGEIRYEKTTLEKVISRFQKIPHTNMPHDRKQHRIFVDPDAKNKIEFLLAEIAALYQDNLRTERFSPSYST